MAANDPFELRLAEVMHVYLDAERPPHPHWLDAPVAQRVALQPRSRTPLPKKLRWERRTRLVPWAIAALVILGVALATLVLAFGPRPGEVGGPSPSPDDRGQPSASPVPTNAHTGPIRYGVAPDPALPPPAAAAGDGSVWLRDGSGNALRFDVASQAVTKVVPLGSGTGAITFGAGSIWATGAEGGRIILSRIEPSTGAIEGTNAYHLGNVAENGLAANGSEVWILQHGMGLIERFRTVDLVATAEFGTSAFDIPAIDSLLGTGTTSADAAFWAGMPATGGLIRIPLPDYRLDHSIPGCGAVRSAADASGLWTVCGNELVRLDLASAARTASVPLPQDLLPPRALALGGGWLWVAAGNSVVQIDPSDGRAVAMTVLAGPGWPVFAAGKLVVVGVDGTLVIITPIQP